jgi:uncharacterized protein
VTDALALVVLAKAPRPGHAKTRLCPSLSEPEAASLAEAMLRDVLGRRWPVSRRLLATMGAEHPVWELAVAEGWTRIQQRGEHLGERMWNAAMDARGDASGVLILGSDAPHVPPDRFAEALDALSAHDAAVVPADDGGYVAIATRPNGAPLFGPLAWGTSHVLRQTMDAAKDAGLRLHVTAPTYDLDEIADLRRLWVDSHQVPPAETLARLAPHAARFQWPERPSPSL